MAENFDREVNLLNVLNGDENQEIEKDNNNNSMILTKSLIKELDDKWDEIEKNNTINSLSLSQKKYYNINSMKKKNMLNDIKTMIRNKLKNNYYSREDNNFENFIKRKKEELKKYKTQNKNKENDYSFKKANKEKPIHNYIQLKTNILENKKSEIPKNNKSKKQLNDEKILDFNKNINKYQSKKKNNFSNTFIPITPIKLISHYKKSEFPNKINSIIMPSTPINKSPLNIESKNKNLNSLYKLIVNN